MWKKTDEQDSDGRTTVRPTTTTPTATASAGTERPARASGTASDRAIIGRSITVRGDVTGDEDLMIQGRIEGSVQLGQHHVTVGPEGRVKANISGRSVTVEGEVVGDLHGDEQVALRPTARVEGDIVSPRVVLDDGASFRGSIDMSSQSRTGTARSESSRADTAPKTTPASEASRPPGESGHKAAQPAAS
jgi:cytoskeletal protein CcmA (bactofilin family)